MLLNTLLRWRHSYLLFCLLAFFASCEHPSISPLDDTKNETGNLTLLLYSIEHTPFADLTRSEISSTTCNRVNYAIYTMDGSRVKQVNQMKGDANFGKASFQLEEGRYQVVVLAHSSNGNPTMTNLEKIQFTNAQGYTDTFYHYEVISIGEESQTLSLSLLRNVALCRFVITGNLPQGATKIQFQYTGGSGAFNAETGFGSVKSTQKMNFDLSSSQKQFDLYTFLHDTEGTIHLTATVLDASGVELKAPDFDIPLKQNEITWFTLDSFGASNSDDTYIDIDVKTEWAGETHITF